MNNSLISTTTDKLKKITYVSPTHKVIGFAIMIGVAFGLMQLFNKFIAPTLIQFIEYSWMILIFGGALALVCLYLITHWTTVIGFFGKIAWEFDKMLIKRDTLGWMDIVADLIQEKKDKVDYSKLKVKSTRMNLERQITALEERVKENVRIGKVYLERKDETNARIAGGQLRLDQQSLSLFKPYYEKAKKSEEFLEKLSKGWEIDINEIRAYNERKRLEFTVLAQTSAALNEAESFINGNNNLSKIYTESIRQAELQITDYLAYIDDFEKRALPKLTEMDAKQQANQDEGLEMLEAYLNSGKLTIADKLKETESQSANALGQANVPSIQQPPQSHTDKYNF